MVSELEACSTIAVVTVDRAHLLRRQSRHRLGEGSMDRPIAEAAWSRLSERFGVANLFTIDFASDLQQRFD